MHAIHSLLRSHSLILFILAYAAEMLALSATHCWALWSAELLRQTRERLPSSCVEPPTDGLGTLLQGPLIKAAFLLWPRPALGLQRDAEQHPLCDL